MQGANYCKSWLTVVKAPSSPICRLFDAFISRVFFCWGMRCPLLLFRKINRDLFQGSAPTINIFGPQLSDTCSSSWLSVTPLLSINFRAAHNINIFTDGHQAKIHGNQSSNCPRFEAESWKWTSVQETTGRDAAPRQLNFRFFFGLYRLGVWEPVLSRCGLEPGCLHWALG